MVQQIKKGSKFVNSKGRKFESRSGNWTTSTNRGRELTAEKSFRFDLKNKNKNFAIAFHYFL